MCCEPEWSMQPGVAVTGPRAAIKAAAPCGALQPRSPGACVLPLSGAEGLEGRDVIQLRDGGHAVGGEHAAALQLPVLVLLQQHRSHQAGVDAVGRRPLAATLGKMPTTLVRRLISSFTRSSRLVLQTFFQWSLGKWRKASTSSLASCISAAALGKRSASEAARSSQRDSISSALSWANTLRRAAVTIFW